MARTQCGRSLLIESADNHNACYDDSFTSNKKSRQVWRSRRRRPTTKSPFPHILHHTGTTVEGRREYSSPIGEHHFAKFCNERNWEKKISFSWKNIRQYTIFECAYCYRFEKWCQSQSRCHRSGHWGVGRTSLHQHGYPWVCGPSTPNFTHSPLWMAYYRYIILLLCI
jgi:hypothetical protein